MVDAVNCYTDGDDSKTLLKNFRDGRNIMLMSTYLDHLLSTLSKSLEGKGRCAEARGHNKDKNHVQQEREQCEEITEVVRENQMLKRMGSEFQNILQMTEVKININLGMFTPVSSQKPSGNTEKIEMSTEIR